MENNRTKKTLPAEVVFAKGLSCTCPSGRIIMQSQCALQLQQCGCITCNIMQPFWGPNLTKQVQTGSVDLQMTPPHHSITYHYRITYTYQSRGHSLANIEVHKMKVPKQTIGTLRAFGGLAGGLKCSWVRTWNIRREQSIPLHRIMTLGLSLRNAVGGSSIAFCSRLENSRTHEMLCTPQLNLVC